MNLSGKFRVRDLWQHEDLGVYDKELAINNIASY